MKVGLVQCFFCQTLSPYSLSLLFFLLIIHIVAKNFKEDLFINEVMKSRCCRRRFSFHHIAQTVLNRIVYTHQTFGLTCHRFWLCNMKISCRIFSTSSMVNCTAFHISKVAEHFVGEIEAKSNDQNEYERKWKKTVVSV